MVAPESAQPRRRRLWRLPGVDAAAADQDADDEDEAARAARAGRLSRAVTRWLTRATAAAAAACAAGGPALPPVTEDMLQRRACRLALRLWPGRPAAALVTPAFLDEVRARAGPTPPPSPPPPPPPRDALQQAAAGLTPEQTYWLVAFPLDWRRLPGLDCPGEPRERVWLVGAASRSGWHRTRLLLLGAAWRPRGLGHVDMRSQPVVYAGGGAGAPTKDLLAWWFRTEFVPAALAVNPSGALLVSEGLGCLARGDPVPPAAAASPPEAAALDAELLANELRVHYASLLLLHMAASGLAPHAFMAALTLRDAFPLLHRAWLAVRSETFERCWAEAGDEPPPEAAAAEDTAEAEKPPRLRTPPVTLSRRAGGGEADRMLLQHLQWLAHNVGLEVSDRDLAAWVREDVETAEKEEPEEPPPADEEDDKQEAEADADEVPGPGEAAEHLRAALRWMETLPLEPGVLMAVRDVMLMAQQASGAGRGARGPGAWRRQRCSAGAGGAGGGAPSSSYLPGRPRRPATHAPPLTRSGKPSEAGASSLGRRPLN
ncbi:hypothetical protein ONE63_003284 [Megalurothrips usitatus]|uniref:Uncharacterized protein n=1 Tax=Megalurothrips usitatus TaxID=439358 RepID=A0AAV7XAT9_9NEOP|nr:hypothetical protein ONE63_003284 [Megalurothrips usitatus]